MYIEFWKLNRIFQQNKKGIGWGQVVILYIWLHPLCQRKAVLWSTYYLLDITWHWRGPKMRKSSLRNSLGFEELVWVMDLLIILFFLNKKQCGILEQWVVTHPFLFRLCQRFRCNLHWKVIWFSGLLFPLKNKENRLSV